MVATLLSLALTAGIAQPPVQGSYQPPAAGGYPRLEAYRLCGVKIAARLERERPKDAAEVLARNATLQCDPLLGAAAQETMARAGLSGRNAQAMTELRQRSIADLAHKITTLRASRSEFDAEYR